VPRSRQLAVGLLAALAFSPGLRAAAPPVLRMPGQAERTVTPESLSGRDSRDVRVEESGGNVTVYHGMALLDVLEKAGLDVKTMAGQRDTAATVVLATARDGYTVVFSLGELRMARENPKVFLVSETANGPLPDDQGPVRLIVYGDRARSAYALAKFEVKGLAENKKKP
jgi:Oxidoreductase molybdopterin binding domain